MTQDNRYENLWMLSWIGRSAGLTYAIACLLLLVATSSSEGAGSTEKARTKSVALEQLALNEDGVQTRYPSVAKIVGKSRPKHGEARPKNGEEEGVVTVPLYYGSGFYAAQYASWGIVLTNWHVVSEVDSSIDVVFPSGTYPGRVVLLDDLWDLAAIIIPKPQDLIPLPISRQMPKKGKNERLWTAGYGPEEGLADFKIQEGKFVDYVALGAPDETGNDGQYDVDSLLYETMMIDVGVRSGDSGGPIFNEYGEVAGCLWGSDQVNSMGTPCGRLQLFLMLAIEEAAKLRAKKLVLAEPGDDPARVDDWDASDLRYPRVDEETKATAIERALPMATLYPTSDKPVYASGNGVDTPEALRALGADAIEHVKNVKNAFWRAQKPGALPPSPPIYSPSFVGMQFLRQADLPELTTQDSFLALDSDAMERARELYRRAPDPRDALDIDEEFAQEESPQYMNAAVVRSKEERRYSDSAVRAESAQSSVQKRFSPLEAYVMFCVVILFLFVMAMPRHPRRGRRPARASVLSTRDGDLTRS